MRVLREACKSARILGQSILKINDDVTKNQRWRNGPYSGLEMADSPHSGGHRFVRCPPGHGLSAIFKPK